MTDTWGTSTTHTCHICTPHKHIRTHITHICAHHTHTHHTHTNYYGLKFELLDIEIWNTINLCAHIKYWSRVKLSVMHMVKLSVPRRRGTQGACLSSPRLAPINRLPCFLLQTSLRCVTEPSSSLPKSLCFPGSQTCPCVLWTLYPLLPRALGWKVELEVSLDLWWVPASESKKPKEVWGCNSVVG